MRSPFAKLSITLLVLVPWFLAGDGPLPKLSRRDAVPYGRLVVAAAPDLRPDTGWWAAAQRALEQGEYHPTISQGTLQAPNRSQNIRTKFRREGVEITPRIVGKQRWTLVWRTVAWGRQQSLTPLAPAEPCLRGTAAVYSYGGLEEWYENRREGLEQGFSVAESPPGCGPLVIRGRLHTRLPIATSDRDGGFDLLDRAGSPILRYNALKAYDARGSRLPARIERAGSVVALVIHDEAAVYPILVDPIVTTPSWSVQGDQPSALFGASVSTAGDVNGDGYSDVIVGAPRYDNGEVDEGRAFLFLGSNGGLPDTSAWSAEGNQNAANLGSSVAPAGDVNGDGYSDVLIGVPGYNGAFSSQGRALLFLGSPSGLGEEGTPDNADWSVDGGQNGARLGAAVAPAGDVNGDGFSDLLVGAPYAAGAQGVEGRASVYHGSGSGPSLTANWTSESDQDSTLWGSALAAAGDVNADGFGDIVIGAPQYSNGQPREGSAFVFLGSASGLGLSGSPANADWTSEGNQNQARFGASVSTAGDVNGDGYADVIVGAPLYDNTPADEGRAFVYLGSATGLAGSAAWTAESDQLSANLGASVAAGGDVNGDGFADVLIGIPGYDGGAADQGRALLYLGSSSGLGQNGTPANADWSVGGGPAGMQYGTVVATGGDVNGDGYSDLLVGSPSSDLPAADSGEADLYQGGPSGPASTPAWSRFDQATSAEFGFSVSTAGDVNGDGYSDVVVGAPGYDGGQTNEGAAFLYLGSRAGLGIAPSWSVESNQGVALLGNSVSWAGDVNGDGYSDVVVGVPLYTNGENDEGAIYLYFGSPSGLGTTPTILQSNRLGSRMGTRVAFAGDINGDGYSDVAAGAPGDGDNLIPRGRAYVWFGSASGLSAGPWMVSGDQDNAEYGFSVAGAGDVNGDGFSDVIVGARSYSAGNSLEGRVYVYLGSRSGLATTAAWRAEADQDSTQFGFRVASAGDVNGDGYSDILIGAPDYDSGQRDEGRAFLYLGSSTGLGANGTPANADWFAEGNQIGAELGMSVGSAGDINGDGYGDVILGAPLYDNPEVDEGRALLFYGSSGGLGPNGTPANADWSVEGNQNGARFGIAGGIAGDVNGDGFGDLIIGADLYDTSMAIVDNGRADIYYGNGGPGLDRIPRQARASNTAPIELIGKSDSPGSFRLKALGRSAAGRSRVRLQWEVEPIWLSFDGTGIGSGPFQNTGVPGVAGSAVALNELVQARAYGTGHRWRLRIAGDSPYFPSTPWMSLPYNGPTEIDLRSGGTTVAVEEEQSPLPRGLFVEIKPNPTGGPATLRYILPSRAQVRLAIFDVQGRLVATLADGQESSGPQVKEWSATHANGSRVPAGVYFARLEASGRIESRKIVLVR